MTSSRTTTPGLADARGPLATGDSQDAERTDESAALQAIERVTDSALAYLSLEELLCELLERVRESLGVDTAAILLHDPDRNVMVARAARGIEEEVRQGVQIPVGKGFAGRIAAERRSIIIDDVDHADILNPLLRRRGIRSLLGVPLLVEGDVIGVMHVGTLRHRSFGAAEQRLLQLAADRAALAIDHARLNEQRALTEVMQRTLLPPAPPQVPGLSLSALYLPAESGIKIGGDWYDVFPLPDGRVALVIGDVVGRGVAAASVMAEIRTALRAYALDGHEPAEVFSKLNTLVATLGDTHSASAAMLAIDVETGSLTAVSAAHLPAVRVAPCGAVDLIAHASGPPLGAVRVPHYREETHSVPPGSSVLLYTDGLIERREEAIDEGIRRLVDAVRASEHDEGSLVHRVVAHLRPNEPAEDDVALLGVEVPPVGPRLEMTLDAQPAVLVGMRRAVARWLSVHGLDRQTVFEVVTAVSEASNNAIEHAYGPRDATFVLELELSEDEEEISAAVSDQGSWRRLCGRAPGRGLALLDELMDRVDIVGSEQGTRVAMTKRTRRC